MKRAILVSSGTLAGLVAVLTYSGGDTVRASADTGAGAAGLGGPPPLGSTDRSTTAPAGAARGATAATGRAGPASPAPTTAAAAAASSAAPTRAAAPAATSSAVKPSPTASKAAAPKPAPTPTATKAAAPKPTPTPTTAATPAGPRDYIGSLETHRYGQVQVGIRVQGGKIIAAWPVVYPDGSSQPYSDFSIPLLESETMAAQSANIATVSGATLTWQAWTTSLQSAIAKAGL